MAQSNTTPRTPQPSGSLAEVIPADAITPSSPTPSAVKPAPPKQAPITVSELYFWPLVSRDISLATPADTFNPSTGPEPFSCPVAYARLARRPPSMLPWSGHHRRATPDKAANSRMTLGRGEKPLRAREPDWMGRPSWHGRMPCVRWATPTFQYARQ